MNRVRAPRGGVVVRSIDRATPARALASIALQDEMSVEIVVVTASGASHPPVLALCGRFPVVRPFPRAEAVDAGIRAATAERITFVEDDDGLPPGHLHRHADVQYGLALVRVAAGDPA